MPSARLPEQSLENQAPLPVYRQIKEYVLKKIRDGIWQEGHMIPTEMSLCEQFDVSRMTVNRALRELVLDGVLERQKGSGTFVKAPKYQSTLIEIRSIAHDIRDRNHTHHCDVLLLEKTHASADFAHQTGIEAHTLLFHSMLVHFENGAPIQVEDRYVNAQVAPHYMEQDWSAITPNESLMRVAPFPKGNYTIDVRMPPKNIAAALHIEMKQPCLVMERITYSNNLFTSQSTMWHPANRFKFTGTY